MDSTDDPGHDDKIRILCVDDERTFGSALASWLERQGFQATVALTADEALATLAKELPQLVLLDWNLGGPLSGLKLCTELLKVSSSMGIIMLTARDDPRDRADALESGADDYVVKPFEPVEFRARIRSVLRRRRSGSASSVPPAMVHDARVLSWGPLTLDLMDQLAFIDGVQRNLTRCQSRLLARLIRASGEVVRSEEIWKDFGVAQAPNLASTRVHVHALRRRIEPHGSLIETWPGRGYAMRKVS